MATNSNKNSELMNVLIRGNAPLTAVTPNDNAGSEGNKWFRDSVRSAQDERFASVWVRLMRAHQKHVDWEAGDSEDGNGNG